MATLTFDANGDQCWRASADSATPEYAGHTPLDAMAALVDAMSGEMHLLTQRKNRLVQRLADAGMDVT